MRRVHAGRSDAFIRSEQGEQGFWPSYADMMSAVALILFFLMLLSYTQNMFTANNLRVTQGELDQSQSQLQLTQGQLEQSQLELAGTQSRLTQTLSQVENAESELNRINLSLDDARLQLTEQDALLAQQYARLAEQDSQIQALEAYRQSASEELVNMRTTLQALSFMRVDIIQQIRDSMVTLMGDSSKVTISDNGSLVFSDGVLFDVNSFNIRPEATPTLDRLIDVFATALSDPTNAQYIDSIVISGHTDWDGSNESNRELSTNRANAVLTYMLRGNGGKLAPYAQYFRAAGYGEARPLPGTDQNTEAGKAANRRIEISVVLKDDSILDVVNAVLDIDMPEGLTATVTTAN